MLHGDDILRAPFPFSNAAVSNIDLINQSPVVPLDPKSEQRNNLRANNQVHPQGQIRRQIEAAPSSRDKNIQQKPGLPKRESVSVKKSPDDGLKLNVIANGNKNRRISKPVVPQSIQRKPTELRVEGQLLSRSPKVSHQVKHVNNEARERRLRYEQVKERKPVKNAANVSPSGVLVAF